MIQLEQDALRLLQNRQQNVKSEQASRLFPLRERRNQLRKNNNTRGKKSSANLFQQSQKFVFFQGIIWGVNKNHSHIVSILVFTALSVSADLFSLHKSKNWIMLVLHPRNCSIIHSLKMKMKQTSEMVRWEKKKPGNLVWCS